MGDLVVGVTSDPDTLFPWKATQFQAFALLGLIYDSLVEFDQDLNVVPSIAESWEVSDDGMAVTFMPVSRECPCCADRYQGRPAPTCPGNTVSNSLTALGEGPGFEGG